MQGDALFEVQLALLGRHLFVELRADDAGGDAVHADVVAGQFAGDGAGHLRESAFHGLVGDAAEDAEFSGGGRNQNDRALLAGAHVGNGGAAEMKDGVDMDIERGMPGFGRDLQQAAGDAAAGGMDEDVETAKKARGIFHDAGAIGGDGAIREDQFAAAAEGLDRLPGVAGVVVFMARHEGDIGAILGKGEGGGGADAAGAAGDEGDFVFEVHVEEMTKSASLPGEVLMVEMAKGENDE
jgi:hypothetical protein